MFCSKCGAPIQDGSKFCSGCGSEIAAASPEEVRPVQNTGHETSGMESTEGMWIAVLILNIIGLNAVSRLITGRVASGILIIILYIVSFATVWIVIGWIGLLIAVIIWIIDLVTVCTGKWRYGDKFLSSKK